MSDSPTVAGLAPIERSDGGYPLINAEVFHTAKGTPYLKNAGVVLTAAPKTDLAGLKPFLAGFGPELDFARYLDDPTALTDGTRLVKAAGQACYASFGPKRTIE